MFRFLIFLLIGCFAGLASADSSRAKSIRDRVVQEWLQKNPSFRLAKEKDCACEEDLRQARKSHARGKTYSPYFAQGDFNGDQIQDFAIVVLEPAKPEYFAVIIFNGVQPGLGHYQPIRVDVPEAIQWNALFFNRRKDWNLLGIGRFETEARGLLPWGNRYVLY